MFINIFLIIMFTILSFSDRIGHSLWATKDWWFDTFSTLLNEKSLIQFAPHFPFKFNRETTTRCQYHQHFTRAAFAPIFFARKAAHENFAQKSSAQNVGEIDQRATTMVFSSQNLFELLTLFLSPGQILC